MPVKLTTEEKLEATAFLIDGHCKFLHPAPNQTPTTLRKGKETRAISSSALLLYSKLISAKHTSRPEQNTATSESGEDIRSKRFESIKLYL